jgi:single-stranded-DNA-specific exonuclease
VQTSWTIREVDDDAVGRLAAGLGVSHITARCLAGRGIADAEAARSYLSPRLAQLRPPVGLAGLPVAVERLARAVIEGQRIGVFGDYDVDGVTTTALIAGFLRQLGASCVARVARRDAGYGFTSQEADFFAGAGCRVIVTGDCGTSDIDAIERAAQRGADVIVVDHHTVPPADPAVPHPALALINPLRADSTFPFRSMASVGLGFYLMAALRTELQQRGFFRQRPAPDVRDLLDLVALGTVSDLVPLRGENRILTAVGLSHLALRRRPGIAALMDIAKIGNDRPVDERTIGWRLGPRLNAPGRMGDAAPALELLLARDAAEAAPWAERIEQANDARRVAQEQVLGEALGMMAAVEPGPAVVVIGRGWPSGITGIVAAKLMELYERPAFVIAVDEGASLGRGSARAPAGYHLYDILARCAAHLVRFGGHAAAAGLTVQEPALAALPEALNAACAAEPSGAGDAGADGEGGGARRGAGAPGTPGTPGTIDAEVVLGEVDARLCRELEQLSPFGQGNEKPLLGCRGMRVRQSRRVGDGAHLKLSVEDRHGVLREGIAFGQGSRDVGPGATIDATFVPTLSTWSGEPRVELEIRQLGT